MYLHGECALCVRLIVCIFCRWLHTMALWITPKALKKSLLERFLPAPLIAAILYYHVLCSLQNPYRSYPFSPYNNSVAVVFDDED